MEYSRFSVFSLISLWFYLPGNCMFYLQISGNFRKSKIIIRFLLKFAWSKKLVHKYISSCPATILWFLFEKFFFSFCSSIQVAAVQVAKVSVKVCWYDHNKSFYLRFSLLWPADIWYFSKATSFLFNFLKFWTNFRSRNDSGIVSFIVFSENNKN